MQLEIKIEDYLSESEIKEIVVSEFRSSLSRLFTDEKEVNRVLFNTAYRGTHDCISSLLTDDQQDTIRTKTEELVNDIKSYSVFYSGSRWGDKTSLAYSILEKTVKDNESLIRENTIKAIKEFSYSERVKDLFGGLQDLFYDLTNLTKKED